MSDSGSRRVNSLQLGKVSVKAGGAIGSAPNTATPRCTSSNCQTARPLTARPISAPGMRALSRSAARLAASTPSPIAAG